MRVFGSAAALLSAGIAAVYPPLILVGTSLMTEPLFIALLLGAVLAALEHRGSRRRWRWVVASGLLAGLAALSRGNGVAIVVPLCFLVWTGRPRWSWRSLSAPAALLAATAAMLAPWTVRNYLQFHTFVPITTQSGFALAGTYNSYAAHRTDYPALWIPPVLDTERELTRHPGIDEADLSARLDGDGVNYIEAHPASPLKVAYWSTRAAARPCRHRLRTVGGDVRGLPAGAGSDQHVRVLGDRSRRDRGRDSHARHGERRGRSGAAHYCCCCRPYSSSARRATGCPPIHSS